MAHFAELDNKNFVIKVVVISNEQIIDKNGNESEKLGQKRCVELFGGGMWVQTSYNSNIRNKFAAIGDYYNQSIDEFITLPKK